MAHNVPNTLQRSNDAWSCQNLTVSKSQIMCVVVGAVLAALAGIATYFCIVNGLMMLDTAYTSLEQFTAGFLIYAGLTFSVVAVLNTLYASGKLLCHKEGKEFHYPPRHAVNQVALSILAPVAALPALLFLGLGAVAAKR